MLQHVKMLALVTIFALTTTSCLGPKPITQVNALATGAEELGKSGTEAYKLIDSSAIERKIFDTAAQDPKNFNDTTILDGFFKKYEKEDALKIRLEMLDHLTAYSSALKNLSSANFQADIDKASKDLFGALGGFNSTIGKATGSQDTLSKETLGIIATVVDGIGSFLAERKRRKAIKMIIEKSDPAVQQACLLIKQEFEGSLLSTYITANTKTAEIEMIKAYQHEATALSFDKRIEAIKKIETYHRKIEGTDQFVKNLAKAAEKLSSTHTKLKEAVAKNKFTTDDLAKEVNDLINIAKSIKNFHDELVKNS